MIKDQYINQRRSQGGQGERPPPETRKIPKDGDQATGNPAKLKGRERKLNFSKFFKIFLKFFKISKIS